jgi:DNA-3-methyladenine glycosylase II
MRPVPPRRRFTAADRIVTHLTPPRLSSLPAEREQLEFSSRSIVFPSDGPRLLRVWGTPDRPVVLGVDSGGDRWRVTAWGLAPPAARSAVRSMFSLDDPIEAFYRLARREPLLSGSLRTFRGLRLPRDPTLYEALVHAILGQQLSVSAANTIKRRLIERTGAVLDVEGREVPRIPSPAELLASGEAGLRAVGASGAKARALLALAERERAGAFPGEWFRRARLDRAVSRLDEEPGVGRWTAENALLRGVGRRDLFIAGDLGLRVALDRFGAIPRSAPEAEARAWGETNYPAWGSYATLYLWRRLVADLAERRTAVTGEAPLTRPRRGALGGAPDGPPRRA